MKSPSNSEAKKINFNSLVSRSYSLPGFRLIAASFFALTASVLMAGWEIFPAPSTEGDLDSGDFMGWVNVADEPFIWNYALLDYVYVPEASIGSAGSWGFVMDLVDPDDLPWTSAYYPTDWEPPVNAEFYTDAFIQDFSYAGYHSGEKPLPDEIEGTFIDVTEAPYEADNTGVTDSTEAIQDAINFVGISGGGVVFLPEGTYKVSPGTSDTCLSLSRSNTVLRGAGADKTFIFNSDSNMRGKSIIKVKPGTGGSWGIGADMVDITQDITTPTKIVHVESVADYAVGDWIVIHNTVTEEWALEHKEPEWTGADARETLRGLAFCRQVTAVNSSDNILEIDVPVRYAILVRDEARVFKAATMIEESGLEGFSIANQESLSGGQWLDPDGTLYNNAHASEDGPAYDSHDSYMIRLVMSRNSWIRDVSSFHPDSNPSGSHMLSNGIQIEECRGVTLQNVHLKNAQYGGGGGNGYAYRFQGNETLVKECTAETFRHGFVMSFMRSSGNVIHRCTDYDTGYVTANNGRAKTGSSGSDFHMWFSPSCLVDEVTLEESYYSILHRKGVGTLSHGTVSAHSVFWNLTANSTRYDRAISTSQTRYGYVIGTSGETPTVRYEYPDNIAYRYDTTGEVTAPDDIVEGVGKGDKLQPQSLYLDQLAKRLGIQD